MIRHARFMWVLLAVLVGGAVAGPGGLVLALEVDAAHPGLSGRVEPRLTVYAGQRETTPIGNLGDVRVTVSVKAKGRPISPYIYGVAAAPAAAVRTLGATMDRWGGNNSSRYNWVLGNAWNAARDYNFENGDYGFTASAPSSAADSFIEGADKGGAAPLITIPSLGWVAANANGNTRSVGVPPQGGAPLAPGGSTIGGYDPAANRATTSVPSEPVDPGSLAAAPSATGPVYENQWVYFLEHKYGSGGVPFYAIDNEPDLWCETDTDVHPACMSYDQTLSMFLQYATAVRAQAPQAQILGPVVSGWTGMFYSALDRGTDNFATHADRRAHGGEAFLPWWLRQVHEADHKSGVRTLNILDVHWYPQGRDVYSSADDPTTAALRIRSVRSLWDPGYADQSWIDQPVDLIPRLEGWVAQDYPGTRVGISEYNFGGQETASGAVALAEALGTFGQQGLYLADYWTYPPLGSPAAAAFELYRDYDGRGATFGQTSVPVRVDQAGVRAYAAVHRSGPQKGEDDVLLTNESPNTNATVDVRMGGAARGDVYLIPPGSGRITVERNVLLSHVHLPPMGVALVEAG